MHKVEGKGSVRYIYITTEAFILLQHVTAVVIEIKSRSGTGKVRGQKISKRGVRIRIAVIEAVPQERHNITTQGF